MTPFFHDEARRRQLRETARAWRGTPFHAHGRHRGVGVDCVGLVVEIYRALGVLPEFAWPPYVVSGGSHLRVSTLAETVAATGRFVRVTENDAAGGAVMAREECDSILTAQPARTTANRNAGPKSLLAQIQCGDLLGFQLGRVIHHAAIALDEQRFIHALTSLGVCEHTWSDPAWPRRLAAIWRPVESTPMELDISGPAFDGASRIPFAIQ